MSTPTPEAAVQHCLNAYNDACARDDARNDHSPESLQRVHLAWRHAMPFLTPHPDAIDAFIACVTHGIVLGVFSPAEGSKLLYAAQVAIGSRRARLEAARLQAKSKHPQIQSAEGAVAAPQVPPTNLPCPIQAPGLIGGWVGDHEPPSTPPPPPSLWRQKPQPAAPQVPPTPSLQPQPARPSKRPPNQIEALLEQLYSGHLPNEAAGRTLPDRRPPTPLPLCHPHISPGRKLTGENAWLR